MGKYIGKRLLQFIPVLLCITFLSFLLMHFAPSDPAKVALQGSGMQVTEETIAAKQAEMGLDRPFLVQYFSWLGNMCKGDFGDCLTKPKTVSEELGGALPASIKLAFFSMILTLIISIPLGILTAVKKNKAIDYIIRVCTFINASIPNFTVAILLIYFVALKWRWVPVISEDNFVGLILPSITLAIPMSARYIRQIRSSVLDELSKDYVIGARIRGIPEKKILYKDVMKNIMITVVTLTGLSMGSLMGGAVVVETIFVWPGIGKMAMDAIDVRDYPVIQGFIVWMALAFMIINLITDISYYFIDPRIRETE